MNVVVGASHGKSRRRRRMLPFLFALFLLDFSTRASSQSILIDALYKDQYHTNYVDYDTETDDQPTCTGGNKVRVRRTIDYASCKRSTGSPCRKCEIYRIRYEQAARPCLDTDPNFRERFEAEEASWLEACPCYPSCNSAARPPISLLLINTAALILCVCFSGMFI